jgi:hypothetical protein
MQESESPQEKYSITTVLSNTYLRISAKLSFTIEEKAFY